MGISYTLQQDDMPDEVYRPLMEEILDMLIDLTPVSTGYAASRWRLNDDTCENDCEYAEYLEEGISAQAPDGIIGPVSEQVPDMVRAAMEEYYAL